VAISGEDDRQSSKKDFTPLSDGKVASGLRMENPETVIRRTLLARLRDVPEELKRRIGNTADDLVRAFLMSIVLRLAAFLLPRRAALALARTCGMVMLWMPTSGRKCLRSMQKCFGLRGAEARSLAAEYLARPFCTFVVFDRILHSRERPDVWPIREKNSGEVEALRNSDRPFIIATGHFQRESTWMLYSSIASPGNLAGVFAPLAARSCQPHNIRERVHFGQLLKTLRWFRPDLNLITVGGSTAKMLEHLKSPRSRLVVGVDAFRSAGTGPAFTRPFAGMRTRTFSVGAAMLSRIAQCPLIACVSFVDDDGTIMLEWGRVIPPPDPGELAADRRTTNAILDCIEEAIGRRPTRYVLYFGEERRWNPIVGAWEG
jgi:lauroyl/myristoyl acyltransferase